MIARDIGLRQVALPQPLSSLHASHHAKRGGAFFATARPRNAEEAIGQYHITYPEKAFSP